MSFDEATAKLGAFYDLVAALSREEAVAQLEKDPSVADAAVAFLTYYLTPLRYTVVDPAADYDRLFALAMALLPLLDAAHRRQALDEALINIADDTAFQFLRDAVRAAYPPRVIGGAIARYLRSDSPLHVYNALNLPYYLFGLGEPYRLDPELVAEIKGAAAALRARAKDLHPLVRDSLDRFVLA